MVSRFCIECKNFEDRMEIDGVVLYARGHRPGVSCQEFQDRDPKNGTITLVFKGGWRYYP